MKKFSLFLLVAVFVIVSIPFSVHAEEVSPCVVPLGCPMDSSHNSFSYAYLDANHHVYQCDFCGYHIRTESHNFVGVTCMYGGECEECHAEGIALGHDLDYDNMGCDETYHGYYCGNIYCEGSEEHPYLFDIEEHEYIGDWEYSSREDPDSGLWYHEKIRYCGTCYYGDFYVRQCVTQNHLCNGVCLVDF